MANDLCGTNTATKNTSGKKQCLEGVVRTYALAKETFSFANLAAAKTKTAWDTAKAAKDIVIFYDVQEREDATLEAIIKNGEYEDFPIKDAVKGVSYVHYLSVCSHEALESYEDSEYTRIFRISNANELFYEEQTDLTIKGEPLKSYIVDTRKDAESDGTPTSKVTLKFKPYVLSLTKPSFDLTEYEGVFDVILTVQGTPTAVELIVEAKTKDRNIIVANLVLADWKFLEGAGPTEEAVTVSSFDALTGFYTLTALAFVTGTIDLKNVVIQTEIMYEGIAAAVTI